MKRQASTIAVFLITLILTLVTWHNTRINSELQSQQRFERVGNIIANTLSDRLQSYVAMLEETRAVFNLGIEISPQQWRHYVDGVQLDSRYPGTLGMGFVKKVPPARAEAKTAAPNDRFIVTLFEPGQTLTPRVRGYDMSSEPAQQATIEDAIVNGEVRVSSVTSDEANETRPPSRILIYAPVFKAGMPIESTEERRVAAVGLVYAELQLSDFINRSLSDISRLTDITHVDFEIYLGDSRGSDTHQNLLYDKDNAPRATTETTSRRYRHIDIPAAGGEALHLHLLSLNGFERRSEQLLPPLTLIIGLGISVLLTRFLWTNTLQAEAVEKSERQLRLVTDALPVLIVYLDRSGKVRFANRLAETWFGLSMDKITGHHVNDLFGPTNFEPCSNALKSATDGSPSRAECRLQTSGGHRVCEVHFIPDFAPHGGLKGIVVLISDSSIAKRKEEQAALLLAATSILHGSLESEYMISRFAHALVPTFADWVAIDIVEGDSRQLRRIAAAHRDPEKMPTFQNMRTMFPLSLDSDDLIGRHLRANEPLFIAKVTRDTFELLGSPERQRLAHELGITSFIMVPLSTRERTVGALFFGRSTPDRLFDQEDFRFAADIGGRAALALENLRLFREVQAANRAKDEFLATVSHELRTPMNVILGWVEILKQERPSEPERAAILETLERNARVQIELINELLDISRIISGKLTLQTKPLHVPDAVAFAVDSVRPAARAKSIRLEMQVDDDIPQILADPDRLHQIMWNLLTNAVKFTPPAGRIQVRISPAPNGLTIEVMDTGQGIEPPFLPFVFDRFRQEDGGASRHHGGLGIGLAIVRYLAELHGGSVTASSAGKGKGATFAVFLPVGEASTLATRQKPEPKPQPEHSPARAAELSNERPLADLDILLIDDSQDVRVLIERILVKAGASVRSVESAEEGLSLLKKRVFDCVISDIGLPRVDGYEFIRRLRANEAARGIERLPAAALTAYAAEKDARLAHEAGYDLHIAKPVRGPDLIQAVTQLIGSRPSPDRGVRTIHGV